MSLVGRYTTPTHIFTVPFDTGTISMMAANENGTVKIYAAGAAPAAMSLQITKIITY